MNQYISIAIRNEIKVTKNFITTCHLAAKEDDGIIDKEEQRQLNKIKKCCERYMRELEKIDAMNK